MSYAMLNNQLFYSTDQPLQKRGKWASTSKGKKGWNLCSNRAQPVCILCSASANNMGTPLVAPYQY